MIKDERLTKNIRLGELLYGSDMDGVQSMVKKEYTPKIRDNLIRLAQVLQILRDRYGPILITAAFRPVAWEKLQGRNGKSQHCLGKAADFWFQAADLKEVFKFINDNFRTGGRAISLSGGFIHYDIRDDFATWIYS